MKTTTLYHHRSSYFGVKVSGDPPPSAAKHANQRLMNSLQISSQHGSQPSHQLSCKFCRLIEFHIKSKHHHFDSLFWRQFKKTDKQSTTLAFLCLSTPPSRLLARQKVLKEAAVESLSNDADSSRTATSVSHLCNNLHLRQL